MEFVCSTESSDKAAANRISELEAEIENKNQEFQDLVVVHER